VVYGLAWIATVPPTTGLATDLFGPRSGPMLFGWVFFGHQVGAALAASGGGLLRVRLGTYHVAFTTAGLLARPSARPASSSPSGRSRGPSRRLPPARRRPWACRGAWLRPGQPPNEPSEGTHTRA